MVTVSHIGATTVYKIQTAGSERELKVYHVKSPYRIETDGLIVQLPVDGGTLLKVAPRPSSASVGRANVLPVQTVYCRLQGNSKTGTYCSGGGCKYPQSCTHYKDKNNDYCACGTHK
jgi:hypothetical protein